MRQSYPVIFDPVTHPESSDHKRPAEDMTHSVPAPSSGGLADGSHRVQSSALRRAKRPVHSADGATLVEDAETEQVGMAEVLALPEPSTEVYPIMGVYAQAETVAITDAGSTSAGAAAGEGVGGMVAGTAASGSLGTLGLLAGVGAAAAGGGGKSGSSAPAETTAPVLQSATIHSTGNRIVLTYDEALHFTTAPASAFVVKVDGLARAVLEVTVMDKTVELFLATPVIAGQTIGVAYVPPAADSHNTNAAMQDMAGNDADGFSFRAVSNTLADVSGPSFLGGAKSSIVVPENSSGTIYAPAAKDNVAIMAYVLADGGADNDKFTINAFTGALTFKQAPDFETRTAYSVRIKAVDASGYSAVQDLSITITDVNEAPTALALGNAVSSLQESSGTSARIKVADIVITDDALGSNTISLSGVDASKFEVLGTTLYLKAGTVLDYETQASYAVTVQVKDSTVAGSVGLSRSLTLSVTDVDEAPMVLTLSNEMSSLQENSDTSARIKVADIVITDDALGSNTISLSGADVGKFEVLGTVLYLKAGTALDYETQASYAVTVQVKDSSLVGSAALSLDWTLQVVNVDETPPIFASSIVTPSIVENSVRYGAAYESQATDDIGVTSYTLSGPDSGLFVVNSLGQVSFKNLPDYEALQDEWHTNSYHFNLEAHDAAGNMVSQDVTLEVVKMAAPTSEKAFRLWQVAEAADQGDLTKNINALNQYSVGIVQQRDDTSQDGTLNQAYASKRLTEWVNRVTGTDVVSDQEFDAGFVITGHAAAGNQGTIAFRLDKDRTDGVDGQDAQVLHLGANDVNGDGLTDVTATYDNLTGDWRLSFAAGSAALLQATHNTWGSGIHQLVVDSDGSGGKNGGEASRLFLVADGTATSSDTGLVSQNYSVQDKITQDVFVYYYGDPDGAGVGMWTAVDSGDSASNTSLATTDRDLDANDWGDLDYYNGIGFGHGASAVQANTANTALHLVTNIGAQTWEFHMSQDASRTDWVSANTLATDHVAVGSNTSRLASLQELVALYGANFGQDVSGWVWSPQSHVVGAVQPVSNANSTDALAVNEDNTPGEWGYACWADAPTPSGHALFALSYGAISDASNAHLERVPVVL